MLSIPAIIDNNYINTLEQEDITSINNQTIAKCSIFPQIRLHQLKQKSEENFMKFQEMPLRNVISSLKKAAVVFRNMEGLELGNHKIRREDYIRLVSESTGLTDQFIESEIDEVAGILENIEDILKVQVPGNIEDVFDNNRYENYGSYTGYYPMGKTLTIKLPGNVPSICLYWIIPLAQKRPIFLIPPKEDLFTHFLLFEAIKKVNPQISSFISFIPCAPALERNLFTIADQLMIPESAKSSVINSPELLLKTYFIHYGRSKFLITEEYKQEYIDMLYRKMTWNNGRTCTGLTSVITTNCAEQIAISLAKRLIAEYENELESKAPAFSIEKAKLINNGINEFIQKGEAVDITATLRAKQRLVEIENKGILFPTILLIKKKNSKAFGLELPFPFITIIQIVEDDEIIEYSRNTLILSVISERRDLMKKLCFENNIFKVFSGKHVERGYNYLDPHEGYLLDFLNTKKAVL